MTQARPLRPHQAEAIVKLRQAIKSGSRRPLLMAPTGAGKTILAAAIIRNALERGKRVIFTVPAISLVDQTAREFYQEGIRDIGVIQADHPMTNPSKPVQIASIQSLMKRSIPDADLVINDEAHRMFAFMADWMARDEWLSVPFIGLSATPWTKGLGRLYDRMIVAATIKGLIDQGFLCPFEVWQPDHPDLSKVATVETPLGRDWSEKGLSRVMSDRVLVASAVNKWLELAEGRPTLCFAVDRTHAQTLQAQFLAAGVSCGYVDMNTTSAEREEIRKKFHSGEYQVVVNIATLTTGIDWDVRCISLCRPTKSEALYQQIIGRGLRTAPGKDCLYVIDHTQTTTNLGYVTQIHHDKLDDGTISESAKSSGEKEQAKPKECPKCRYVRPAELQSCPKCGHVTERVSGVEVVEGELVKTTNTREQLIAQQVQFMAELRKYQQVKGKPDTWVLAKFKGRFREFPQHRVVREVQPALAISPETQRWLTASNIRFAKGRAKQGAAA